MRKEEDRRENFIFEDFGWEVVERIGGGFGVILLCVIIIVIFKEINY